MAEQDAEAARAEKKQKIAVTKARDANARAKSGETSDSDATDAYLDSMNC